MRTFKYLTRKNKDESEYMEMLKSQPKRTIIDRNSIEEKIKMVKIRINRN